jgi:DNA-binding NtrC family response regulator
MLNGPSTPSQHYSSSQPRGGSASFEDLRPPACDSFVCVGTTLRRLLLQAEITAPRLQLATLEGEAGAGKHLLAQNIHHQSNLTNLADRPFRRHDAREWLANEADVSDLSGTLYLDRVDLLAQTGQGLLLNLIKILQNDSPSLPRFLLLVSTHVALRPLAGQGQFLPDLAFRLTAVRFAIPPLREHREDIATITQALIERICRRYQQPTALLGPGTLPRLLQHSWPGNVRELASVLESAILDSHSGIVRPNDLALNLPREGTLPGVFSGPSGPSGLSGITGISPPLPEVPEDLTLDAAIRRHIQLVLERNRGNKLRAARQLGISRSTLYRLLSGAPISPMASLDT